MDDIEKRLRLIEQRKKVEAEPRQGGLLERLPYETNEQATTRANAEGRVGPFLILPKAPQTDEEKAAWEKECAEYHVVLLAEGQRLVGTPGPVDPMEWNRRMRAEFHRITGGRYPD